MFAESHQAKDVSISPATQRKSQGDEASTAGRRIFVVEDEPEIAKLIQYNLSLAGFEVKVFSNGTESLKAIADSPPDLVLLDIMLPGVDGLTICEKVRSMPHLKDVSIMMVMAKGTEKDIIHALEIGADDYVTKPFSPKILVARVKSVLRRGQEPSTEQKQIEYGNLVIHPGRRSVMAGGEELTLTSSEFDILHFLLKKPGWVFTRSQIVKAVRGQNYAVTDRSIDVQIVGLRRKLGAEAENIETVRGVGYRVKEL